MKSKSEGKTRKGLKNFDRPHKLVVLKCTHNLKELKIKLQNHFTFDELQRWGTKSQICHETGLSVSQAARELLRLTIQKEFAHSCQCFSRAGHR